MKRNSVASTHTNASSASKPVSSFDRGTLNKRPLAHNHNNRLTNKYAKRNHNSISRYNSQRLVCYDALVPMKEASQRASCVLDPSDTKLKPGPGGRKLMYVDTQCVIDQLNRCFGIFGWSTHILRQSVEKKEGGRTGAKWCATVTMKMTITSEESIECSKQDTGVAYSTGSSGGEEQAIKSATSDAIKRCARLFGPAFGLALYCDKYRSEIKNLN